MTKMGIRLLHGARRHPQYVRRAVCTFQTERMAIGERGLRRLTAESLLVLAGLRRRDLRLDEFQYLATGP